MLISFKELQYDRKQTLSTHDMATFGFSMVPYHRFVRNFIWKQSAKFHTKMFYRSGEKRDFVKTCWTKNPNSGLMCLRFSLKSHKIHVIKEFKVSCVRCAILNGFPLFKRSADLKTFACLCVARQHDISLKLTHRVNCQNALN